MKPSERTSSVQSLSSFPSVEMKRCPTCRQTYADETLKFCRFDGSALADDASAPLDARATLVKLPPGAIEDMPTALLHGSDSLAGGPTSSSLTAPLLPGRKATRSKRIDSLAVLPLENAGGDPAVEYLSDGITEAVINSLSQLPRLRVIPRSTVFRYKGRDVDPQAVGRELGARAVLSGRMTQVGEQVVVSVELVDVLLESQLWGEQYRRRVSDIFSLQEELSKEISDKLRLKLSGEEKKRLTKRPTENAEAFHAYLRGRYYTNKRTTGWIRKGIEFFQQGIDLDPSYALAYSGMADAYAFLASSTGERPPREFYPKARAAALKALELDDGLAEAHTTLGFYQLLYEWDFEEAGREFRRAIELNPNNANAHDGLSFYLKATGRHDEAVAECKRAQKLDPLSLFANVSLAWAFYFARRYDRAAEQNRKALELDERFTFAYWNLGVIYAQQGRHERAVEALERANRFSEGGTVYKAHLAYAYALAGREADARGRMAELEEEAKRQYVSAYFFAVIHLGLNETEQALEWLERAFDERSGFLAFLRVEPMFDPLRSEERFKRLEGRIGRGRERD